MQHDCHPALHAAWPRGAAAWSCLQHIPCLICAAAGLHCSMLRWLVKSPPYALLDLRCCWPALQQAPLTALPGTLQSCHAACCSPLNPKPPPPPVQRRQASSQLTAWSMQAASKAVSAAEKAQRAVHYLELSRPLLLSQKPPSEVADMPQPSYRRCRLLGRLPQMHTWQQPSQHCCRLMSRLPQMHTCPNPHTIAAAKQSLSAHAHGMRPSCHRRCLSSLRLQMRSCTSGLEGCFAASFTQS